MIETLMICKADMTHHNNAYVRCYLTTVTGVDKETIFTATKCY